MFPNPWSSPIIKHEENVIINSVIDRLQDMGERFLGMGSVFLGPLFKSWSDMPTHAGMIPPTLWENA